LYIYNTCIVHPLICLAKLIEVEIYSFINEPLNYKQCTQRSLKI
jgi:hypothetical protein